MSREADQELLDQATEFADELNATMAGVLEPGGQPTFQASINLEGPKPHLLVVPVFSDAITCRPIIASGLAILNRP